MKTVRPGAPILGSEVEGQVAPGHSPSFPERLELGLEDKN